MLVYRSSRRCLDIAEVLSDLECRIAGVGQSANMALENVRSILIDAGELEAGVVDVECAERDDESVLASALDGLMQWIGEAFASVWKGASISDTTVACAREGLRGLHGAWSQDAGVEVSTPEGFAFYGLFPEMYIDAAEELIRSLHPTHVMVIGIRSIGTTLSAAVAGALRRERIAVRRVTVRPRGHPFDRELRLGAQLLRYLREAAASSDVLFAIVDEGPGLSGSSFTSVVHQLSALGVASDRIVLFPSWNPAADVLGNERAQRTWPRHRKFVGDFDRAWIDSCRLGRSFGATMMRDLSAGAWREMFFTADRMPAVQPQHERRKFLAERSDGQRLLLKFEGLDRMALTRRTRAERAGHVGFGPPVERAAHGFVATRWVDGSPVDAHDVGPELIRHVARYLAWMARCERTGREADPEPLMEMLRVNVNEGLGAEWGAAVASVGRENAASVGRAPAVRVDGRMLRHEWVRVQHGFVKVDGNSHFDDHFYPGETDVAWDLAAASIELDLDAAAERMLLREYQARSGDRDIVRRLRFMRPAYAAFRAGYATVAAATLGTTGDGERMHRAAARYGDVLKRELSAENIDGQSYATGAEVPAR